MSPTLVKELPLDILRLVIWYHIECRKTLSSLCKVSRSIRDIALPKYHHNSIVVYHNPTLFIPLLFSWLPRADRPPGLQPLPFLPQPPPGYRPPDPTILFQSETRNVYFRDTSRLEIQSEVLKYPKFVKSLALMPELEVPPDMISGFHTTLQGMRSLVVFKLYFRDRSHDPATIDVLSTLPNLRDLVIWRLHDALDDSPEIPTTKDDEDKDMEPGGRLRSITLRLGDLPDPNGGLLLTAFCPNKRLLLAKLRNLIVKNASTFRHLAGQFLDLITILEPRIPGEPIIRLLSLRFTDSLYEHTYFLDLATAWDSLIRRQPPVVDFSHLYHIDSRVMCSAEHARPLLEPLMGVGLPELREVRVEASLHDMGIVPRFLEKLCGLEELILDGGPVNYRGYTPGNVKPLIERHGKTLKRLVFCERLGNLETPAAWFATGMPRLEFLGLIMPTYMDILAVLEEFKEHASLKTLFIEIEVVNRPIEELLWILNTGGDSRAPAARISAQTLRNIIVVNALGGGYILRVKDGLWKIISCDCTGVKSRYHDLNDRRNRALMDDTEAEITHWYHVEHIEFTSPFY